MPKTIDAAFRAKAVAEGNKPLYLLELELDSGTLYLCDAEANVTFPTAGNAYLSWGFTFDEVRNGVSGEIDRVKLSFNNVSLAFRGYTDTDDFQGRRITIRRIFSDLLTSADYSEVIFTGLMDAPAINERTVDVEARSPASKLNSTIPRRRFQNNCHWKFDALDCHKYPADLTAYIAWWPMNMGNVTPSVTVLDVSGNGESGTSGNSLVFADGWYGEDYGAIEFNGTTDAIDCGSDLINAAAVTVGIKMYPETAGEGNAGVLFSNGKLIIAIDNTNARISVTSDGGGTTIYSANTAWVANTWNALVVKVAANGTANIYINGALSGAANQASGVPAAGTSNLFIGNNAATTATFDGRLCDAWILSGVTSTAAQIMAMYSLGIPTTGTADAGGSTTTMVDAARTEADDYWRFGTLEITSGDNDGLIRPISDFVAATDTTTLLYPFPYTIAAGVTYTIRRGCNKTSQWCSVNHTNWANSGGFVGLPQRKK